MMRPRVHVIAASLVGMLLTATISIANAPAADGKAWFYSHVIPKLIENGCPACHATGYLRPQVTTYEELLPYLAMGWTADNNVLIYKMANLRSIAPDRPTHPGGKRCVSIDAEPCKTMREWWCVEFGPPMPAKDVAQ